LPELCPRFLDNADPNADPNADVYVRTYLSALPFRLSSARLLPHDQPYSSALQVGGIPLLRGLQNLSFRYTLLYSLDQQEGIGSAAVLVGKKDRLDSVTAENYVVESTGEINCEVYVPCRQYS
jgi:hypothetical protein